MKELHHKSPLPHPFEVPMRAERRDAMEHRQRILEVARRLFTEHGVDAVNMHQIAVAAGIGQGTLYRRYANKGALCVDLLRESHERFAQEVAALFSVSETTSALKRLDSVLTIFIRFIEEQGDLLESATMHGKHFMPCDLAGISRRFSLSRDPFYSWLHELLVGLLTEAVNQKELAPLDIPYTADAILATLNPIAYSFQRQERGYPSERILQGLRHIYIDGLQKTS